MALVEYLWVALDALRMNKVRSFLTMLGVIIGVTSVILLVSMGEGIRSYVSDKFAELGTQLLVIAPGQSVNAMESTQRRYLAVHNLTYEDSQALKNKVSCLEDVAPVITGHIVVKHMNKTLQTSVYGTTASFKKIRNVLMDRGSFFRESDVDNERRVCVVGWTIKKKLYPNEDPIGKFIKVGDQRFRIIGLASRRESGFGMDLDNQIFIPLLSAQRLYKSSGVTEIQVNVRSGINHDIAKQMIRNILFVRHKNNEDFTITSSADVLSTFRNVLRVLTMMLGGIAGISLVVGGVGIMNIMLVSVRERIREIGIRRAVGARRHDILLQFIVEAVTLSTIGGILGILFGAGLAQLVPILLKGMPTKISLWTVSVAVSFSVSVGIFFGVYPAYKASRLNPIEALRHE